MYPVLMEIGNIFVSSLWMLVSAGIFIWGVALIKLTQAESLKMAFLVNSFFKILLAGALAGRVIHLLVNFQDLIADPKNEIPLRIISFWDRGFNFWGIVAGMMIYLYYAAKKNEENIGKWLDILTLSFLAAIPFGHIGALLEGISYGKETDLPWGIIFESFTVPYTVPIHPTQIYALVYSIAILLVLRFIIVPKKLVRDGEVTLVAAASYGAFRFIEEFFRGDEAISLLGFNLAHWVSLAVFLFAGISLLIRYNKLNFILKLTR